MRLHFIVLNSSLYHLSMFGAELWRDLFMCSTINTTLYQLPKERKLTLARRMV